MEFYPAVHLSTSQVPVLLTLGLHRGSNVIASVCPLKVTLSFLFSKYIVGGGRRQNSLDYYDAFSYPSLVVILNSNIRNEY